MGAEGVKLAFGVYDVSISIDGGGRAWVSVWRRRGPICRDFVMQVVSPVVPGAYDWTGDVGVMLGVGGALTPPMRLDADRLPDLLGPLLGKAPAALRGFLLGTAKPASARVAA